ncbi:hypothetical protein LTR50_003579 [Elasticomyces elasticus]|nr:hypothetical protein LTR50_003579 [Elasticomyces elasticus]
MLSSTDRTDSPLAVRYIPLAYDNTDSEGSALRLVHTLFPEWKASDEPVSFVKFTDGITNTASSPSPARPRRDAERQDAQLLKATVRRPGKTQHEADEEAVLLRAYGKGTDVLIDRERESKAHSLLASRGLAPPLLARFENGLLYRYIEGDVCSPEDLRRPEIWRAVAKRLGQWHACLPISAISTVSTSDPPAVVGSPTDPPSKPAHSRPSPDLWSVMQQWIHSLPDNTEEQKAMKEKLDKELVTMTARLGDTPGIGGNDYIFSHCDLLSGNVIIQPASGSTNGTNAAETPEVSFIDYEYATPAPAAFDIANHFAEWAGFSCDHSALPTKSQRADFLAHYLRSYRSHLPPPPHASHDAHQPNSAASPFEADLARLTAQVDLFRGVPGFYWGIWALIQETISQIDFDYAAYAPLRLGEYWAWKAEDDGSRAERGREVGVREGRWACA